MKKNRILQEIYQNPSLPSFVVLILLVLINALLQPNFFSYRSFKSNLLTFTPLVLISIAQAFVIISGAVDLSIGAAISLITVLMASIMGDSVGSILLAIGCTFGLASLLGLFNGFFISYLGPPPLIMTFATSTIWFGIALYIMPTPGGYIPKMFYRSYKVDLFHALPVPVIVLGLAFLLCVVISKLRFYKHLYAVGGNAQAAYASGIHVLSVKIRAFLLSAVFVALSAICVVAQTATGDARSGLGYTLNSVAAAIIGGISFAGGKGSVAGAAMGGLILGLLINIIYFANITSFYQEFTKGLIIIISLAIGAIPRLKREMSQYY